MTRIFSLRKQALIGILVILLLISTMPIGRAIATTPSITAVTPGEGVTLTVSDTSISFKVTDNDGISSSGYSIKLNGNLVASQFEYTIGHWEYDTCYGDYWVVDSDVEARIFTNTITGLKDGTHTVQVQARDRLGNTVSKTWSFNVAAKPSFSNLAPTAGSYSNGDAVSVKVTDNDGINASSIVMTVDGVPVVHAYNAATGIISYTASPLFLEGVHTVTISANDIGGNQGTVVWNFTTYKTAPTMNFSNSGQTLTTKSPLLSVVVNSAIDLAQFSSVKLDGTTVIADFQYKGRWLYDSCGNQYYIIDSKKEGTISYQASNLSEGPHTLEVTAKDYIGNTTTKQWTFYVNTSPTVLQLNSATYNVTEGGEATVTVSRTGGLGGPVSVNYATGNGTALAGTDYTTASGTLSFAPFESTKTFAVTTIDDAIYENSETVNLTLSNPIGASLGTQKTAVLTITDNDPVPTVSFDATSYTITEGGTVTLTVTLTGQTSLPVTTFYATSNSTASAPGDYTSKSGFLTFNPGQTSKTITVGTVDDSYYEGDEKFFVVLGSTTGGVLGENVVAVVTINDNDPPPSIELSAASYTVIEGGTASITITRTGDNSGTATVQYTTSDISAKAGEDYIATSGTVTFAPGEASKTLSVVTLEDNFYEGAETVGLTLSNPVNAALGRSSAVLTINDNDTAPKIAFSLAEHTVTEGESLIITVSRTGAIGGTSTVQYATSNGTSVAGQDYMAVSGTMTFGPGETSKTFVVNTIDDTLYEEDETINLLLTNPGIAELGEPSTAVITITDNDIPPIVEFSAASYDVTEGKKGVITVKLTGGVGKTVTVDYATSNGTAVAGSDYNAASGTLTFMPGENLKSLTITTLEDSSYEGTETLVLTLNNPNGAFLGTQHTASLNIVDNDAAPLVQLSATTYAVAEGKVATVTVKRTGALGAESTVKYATSDGTAESGTDYEPSTGTLVFAPGQSTKTFTVNTITDGAFEGNETIEISLTDSSGAMLGLKNKAVLTVKDADRAPVLEFESGVYSVVEGETVVLTITRTGPVNGPSTVTYATVNGTAVAADYVSSTGVINFAAGETLKTINIETIDDTLYENKESFIVVLSAPNGATLGKKKATILNIEDNDIPPTIELEQSDYNGNEGENLVITIRRTGDTTNPASVRYTSRNVTAVAGTDYKAVSGTLSFASGEASKTITVNILDDAMFEGSETFAFTLTNPVGAILGMQKTCTVTINEKDGSLVRFTAPTFNVLEGGTVTVSVERIGDSTGTSTVGYRVTGGTAKQGSDFALNAGTLTFGPGETVKYFDITTINDSLVEAPETINLALVDPVGSTIVGTVEQKTTVVYINDDDIPTSPVKKIQFESGTVSRVPLGNAVAAIILGTCQDGSVIDLTAAVEWKSSKPKVATIEGGLITGQGTGTTVITAKYGKLNKKITIVVR